jgi:hypothetical protein
LRQIGHGFPLAALVEHTTRSSTNGCLPKFDVNERKRARAIHANHTLRDGVVFAVSSTALLLLLTGETGAAAFTEDEVEEDDEKDEDDVCAGAQAQPQPTIDVLVAVIGMTGKMSGQKTRTNEFEHGFLEKGSNQSPTARIKIEMKRLIKRRNTMSLKILEK